MKKYVFLVKGIEDLTGGPRYVNNKCRWLKEHGWNVIVFWSYDVGHAQLEHLKPFDKKDYIIHELQFYPCWFTKHHQKRVLDRIVLQIGQADQMVVESNKLQLGAWGEMLAQRLGVKHINFVTTEKIRIQNKSSFDFFYTKLKRKEFFAINAPQVKNLFSKFIDIEHPEDYFWSAMMGVEVEDYEFPDFDRMPQADYTITSFGRTKGYFPKMLEELRLFLLKHTDKTFNVFFLGDLNNESLIHEKINLDNVNLVLHPKAVVVIPRQVFTKSDVIIATAGCAALASRNGGKVISMDVNNNKPLGLYGYTTWDTNTFSGKYPNKLSLTEWLQVLLVDRTEYEPMEDARVAQSFDDQIRYATPPDGKYLDVTKVKEKITRWDNFLIILSKLGMFKVVDYLFFKKKRQLTDNQRLKERTNNNRRLPVIVEFNGLPGLGKTTVANILNEELKKLGYKTVMRNYGTGILGTLYHRCPRLYNADLYRKVCSYSYNILPKGKKRTHVNFIPTYVYKYECILKQSGADFAIIDEALIQFLTAIAFKDRIPVSDSTLALIEKIKSIGVGFIRVDCVNDIEVAADRIMSRPSRGLIFETMQKSELIKTLQIEAANFDYLRSAFSHIYKGQHVISIDTVRKKPEDNAEVIKNQILKLSSV